MQRSFGLMALDIASKQQQNNLVSSPEPNSPISSPCSPVSRLETYNPILRLKDLGENATQLLGIQHHEKLLSLTSTTPATTPATTTVTTKLDHQPISPLTSIHTPMVTKTCNGSQSSSIQSSPQASPNQMNCVSPQQNSQSIQNIFSISSLSGQMNVGHLLSPNAIKSLKFSIDNILKPEFGRNQKEKRTYQTANSLSSSSSSSHSSSISSTTLTTLNNKHSTITSSPTVTSSNTLNTGATANKVKKTNSFDITSLAGKRKHSSDSECSTTSSFSTTSKDSGQKKGDNKSLWPAWVYCTRYSDRPSSGKGPRSRRMKKKEKKTEEKRPRTAFTADQLARLKQEFQENRYLTERRRQDLARELKLNESQIKIWFQNKRAKIKKSTGSRNPLALHLMAQGLYNHSTMPVSGDDCDNDDDDDDDNDDDEMIVDDRKGSNGSTSSESNKNL